MAEPRGINPRPTKGKNDQFHLHALEDQGEIADGRMPSPIDFRLCILQTMGGCRSLKSSITPWSNAARAAAVAFGCAAWASAPLRAAHEVRTRTL